MNVTRKDGVHVLSEKCATCIFRPGNKMMLEDGRVESMEEEAVANDSAIICHDTIYRNDTEPSVCRGFWDKHKKDSWTLRYALLRDFVVYDEQPLPRDQR